jgi:hypothetical protein
MVYIFAAIMIMTGNLVWMFDIGFPFFLDWEQAGS